MNGFNLGEVLTKAWQNIWKHKVLWIFGILASCARGGGGSGGSSGNSGYQTGSGEGPFNGQQFEGYIEQAGSFLEQNWWIFIVLAVVIILLSFVFYALGIIGRIGMVKGTLLAEKDVDAISFGEVWSESLPYFWRIFGLNFLIGLAVFILVFPAVLFGILTAGIGFLCILPLLCLLIPLGLAISVVLEIAQPAIVVENLGMLDGLKRGWELVKANVGTMIILWLVLGIGGGIVGLVIAVPVILAFIPVFFSIGTLGTSLTPLYISLACCAVYMPVLIFLNEILTAYIQSVWALTYLRITQPKADDGTPQIIEANA